MKSPERPERQASSFEAAYDFLGGGEPISITETEFNTTRDSLELVFAKINHENNFIIMVESYIDLKRFIYENSIRHMIYSGLDDKEIFSGFSRKMMGFLSASRFYIDAAPNHIHPMTFGILGKSHVNDIFSKKYENSISYRILTEIRNYSQHYAIPVTGYKIGASWNDNFTFMTFYTEYLFASSKVVKPRFKKKILDEIDQLGGSVSLISLCDDYFNDICESHHEISRISSAHIDSGIENIKKIQQYCQNKSGKEDLTGLYIYSKDATNMEIENHYIGVSHSSLLKDLKSPVSTANMRKRRMKL